MTTHDELLENATRIKLDLEADMRRYGAKLDDEDGDGQEEIEEQYSDSVLSVTRTLKQSYSDGSWSTDGWTIDVLLCTGGPAYGVTFTDSDEARVWYQDWFTEKTYVDLNRTAAGLLWSIWYLDGVVSDLED